MNRVPRRGNVQSDRMARLQFPHYAKGDESKVEVETIPFLTSSGRFTPFHARSQLPRQAVPAAPALAPTPVPQFLEQKEFRLNEVENEPVLLESTTPGFDNYLVNHRNGTQSLFRIPILTERI